MKNYLSVELITSTLNFSFFLDFRETLTTFMPCLGFSFSFFK